MRDSLRRENWQSTRETAVVGYAGPILTVGSANTIGASTGPGANTAGDTFVDTDWDTVSVWNGANWDELGDFRSLAMTSGVGPYVVNPCLYCGTLNPPDAVECGAGRWNGCGAPSRE